MSKKSNSDGFSLIETLIALGIMGVILVAVTSMLSMQHREAEALAEKMGALALQNQLQLAMLDGAVCTNMLKNQAFDSALIGATNPLTISVPKIPGPTPGSPDLVSTTSGLSASLLSAALIPESIEVSGFQGAASPFLANVSIKFKSDRIVRAIRLVSVPISIVANNTGGTNWSIQSCTSYSGGAGTSPAGTSCGFVTGTYSSAIFNSKSIAQCAGNPITMVMSYGPLLFQTSVTVNGCPSGYAGTILFTITTGSIVTPPYGAPIDTTATNYIGTCIKN